MTVRVGEEFQVREGVKMGCWVCQSGKLKGRTCEIEQWNRYIVSIITCLLISDNLLLFQYKEHNYLSIEGIKMLNCAPITGSWFLCTIYYIVFCLILPLILKNDSICSKFFLDRYETKVKQKDECVYVCVCVLLTS